MPAFRFTIADVFTDRPLAGNQLAVFTDATRIPDELLQPLARELNFSETVFVYPPAAGGHAAIRIFTPAQELPFAGHPVLGAALVLGRAVQLDELHLETAVGIVPVVLEREAAVVTFARMSQPIPKVEPFLLDGPLLAALGVERSHVPVELYDNGPRHVFAVLESDAELRALEPDVVTLAGLPVICAVCAARSARGWRVRSFCPGIGVREDPATGSAAGPLACHLARHGLIQFGEEVEISQGAEAGRPSTIYARADGSPERIERVEVGGSGVVVARGEFQLP